MRANRYVSYLAAEIEPQAYSNMRTFERAAEQTMDRIATAGGKGSAGIASSALGLNIKRNTDLMVTGGSRARAELQRLDVVQRKVGTGAQLMGAGFSRAADALQVVQGPLGPLAGRLSALGQVLRSLTGFTLAGVLAGGGAFALGGIATQYQHVHDTLVPFFQSQKDLNGALNDVVGIAQRSRQALQPVADLYVQITRVARDAGLSQQRAARLTETVAKASQIGGGTAEGKAAAVTQFGQALGANFKGSSQELQSILEQASGLAQAIAHGLGVKTSQLKQLAQEGKLSTEIITQALERTAEEVDATFSQLPPRVGQSLTQLSNNLSIFIGRADETLGATSAIANGILFLSDHLRELTVVAGLAAGAFIADSFVSGVSKAAKAVDNLIFRLGAIAPLTREQTALNELYKRQIADTAQATLNATAAEIRASNQYQVQLRAQIALLEKQRLAQVAALEAARALDAASRTTGGGGRPDLVKAAYQDLNATERALILTQEQLIATDNALAAAEARMIEETVALSAANVELAAAETAAAASTGRLAAAKSVLQGAMTRVASVASGLVNFLGGPWGVAFTAAAGWVTYLATQHDFAREAIDRFKGSEEELLSKLENTTTGMQNQALAATQLARALREADIAKAQQSARSVGGQLSGDLGAAAANIMSGHLIYTGQQKTDAHRLQELADKAKGAALSLNELNEVMTIVGRNPGSTKGDFIERMFGNDSSRVVEDLKGVVAATYEVQQAQKDLADFDKRQNAKQKSLIGGGTAPSKSLLNAQARVLAAQDPLSKARADLALAMKQGPNEGETDEQYKQRIAGLIQSVNGLVEAKKSAARASAEERHQQALVNKELREAETARDKGMRLAGLDDQFSDDTPIKRLERLRDAAAEAKRKIDDLVGERVIDKNGDRIFSKDEAQQKKDQIDAYEQAQETKPFDDLIQQSQDELRVQDLISQGLGDQAELIRRKLELEKQMGPLTDDQVAQIREQITQQDRLNDVLAERTDIIENNARFLDSFRDSLENAVSSIIQGKFKSGFKNFFRNIYQAFADAKAHEIVMKLIGDPGKKYRDEMTRGLNTSADNLTTSASNLDQSAQALGQAADAISAATQAQQDFGVFSGPDGTTADSLLGTGFLDPFSKIADKLEDIPSDGVPTAVVTGTRPPKGLSPGSVDQLFGQQIGALGGALVSVATNAINSLFGGVGEQGGAVTGGKFSDMLGSIGQTVAQFIPELGVGMAATSAISKIVGLPNFAGGAFGILGNLVAKAFGFGKTKRGSATITDLSGNYGLTGNSSSAKDAATGGADSVVSGLQRILDALGAQMGNFAVSVGYNAKKKKYVVDTEGRGRIKSGDANTPEFDNEEDAVRFAILNAIQDGAVKGIHEGAIRLLKAGRDLDSALDKAVKFENVFKELKRIKDPVGAAIDDLNDRFQELISIFTQAGASAEEWSQLQELYDLDRADAIKQATQDTVSVLDDFIKSITSGQDSPLSKRTVYNNAKAAVDAFRGDIAAGKDVDQDKLVQALQDFEAASSDLFGSRGQFFADFNDILQLANEAKANLETPNDGTLPPSPFDSLTPIAQGQLNAQNTTNDLLGQILGHLGGGGGGSGLGGGSTINGLPFYSGGGGGSGGVGGGGSAYGGDTSRGGVAGVHRVRD